MTTTLPRILITPGEPAGIGPDITIQIAQLPWDAELIVVADPDLLTQRAAQLNLALTLIEYDLQQSATIHTPGTLKIIPIKLNAEVTAGKLNPANAAYVLKTLEIAADLCEKKQAQAIITGPVQKSVMNEAGIAFSGHTEFFADHAHVKQTVMFFVADQLKVALATTHLPLTKVSAAITRDKLISVITILYQDLQRWFDLSSPHIAICGLNPHAGESGHLGREEIEIITPTLNELRAQGLRLSDPLSADTIFNAANAKKYDAILAMYHDQALPVVKYASFGHAVNVTLGLPYLRTSVDHGTALDLAGTGRTDAGSMHAALKLAIELS